MYLQFMTLSSHNGLILLIAFLITVTIISDGSNLRRKGFILAHGKGAIFHYDKNSMTPRYLPTTVRFDGIAYYVALTRR